MSARWPSDVPGRWPSPTRSLSLGAGGLRTLRKHACKQPSHSYQTTDVSSLVTDNFGTHKKLGCMFSRIGSGNADAHVTYPLQAAMPCIRTKWLLLDKTGSTNWNLQSFEATISPIPCFAARFCSIRHRDLRIFDVEFRRRVRSVLRPPFGICWCNP